MQRDGRTLRYICVQVRQTESLVTFLNDNWFWPFHIRWMCYANKRYGRRL